MIITSAKQKINYKTSIGFLFAKNRHIENIVKGNPSQQQNQLGITIIFKCETLIKITKFYQKRYMYRKE